MLKQAGELADNRAYLDRCPTVTAFKTDKYLREIEMVPGGIKMNCNAGAVMANKRGKYGRMKVWYIPDGIVYIFSMHELEIGGPVSGGKNVFFFKWPQLHL